MLKEKNPVSGTAGREIAVTRVINAPRELVFNCFTDPKHIGEWWGPVGFSTTTEKMDVRPGGMWKHVMHGPDGTDYDNEIVYVEIVKPKRLVYDHVSWPKFRSTITLEEQDGKTKLSIHMLFESVELLAKVIEVHKADEGLKQTVSRLDAYITKNANSKNGSSDSAKPDLVITRILDAPRNVVFKAWTDEKQMAKWWGPNGFTNSVCKMDVRPGGAIHIDMKGPDGVVYPMKGEFQEIVPNERLVFISKAFEDGKGNHLIEHLSTITFAEHNGKTKLTLQVTVFKSSPEIAGALEGMEEGWKQSFDKLAGLIAPTSHREMVIARIFNAPRELVFKAFTDPEHLMHWWGPKGFKMLVSNLDLRPGGVFHYAMSSPEGHEMWGKFVYHEIAAPKRMVFVNSFSDKDGNLTRHPMSSTWPLEVRNTLTLLDQNGKTALILRGGPINATEEEIKTFETNFDSMQKGFAGTFDQLDEYLAQAVTA